MLVIKRKWVKRGLLSMGVLFILGVILVLKSGDIGEYKAKYVSVAREERVSKHTTESYRIVGKILISLGIAGCCICVLPLVLQDEVQVVEEELNKESDDGKTGYKLL